MGALSPPSRALGQVVSNSSAGRAGPQQATLSVATLYSERARSVAAENSAAALPLCSALREILAFGGRLEVYISPLAKGRATPTKRSAAPWAWAPMGPRRPDPTAQATSDLAGGGRRGRRQRGGQAIRTPATAAVPVCCVLLTGGGPGHLCRCHQESRKAKERERLSTRARIT